MAARVGNRPSQLAATNNIKKIRFQYWHRKNRKTTKQNASAYAKATMRFDIHINHIVTCAHRLANIIHKCFTSRDLSIHVNASICHICQTNTWICFLCWSPCNANQVTKIKAVQLRFTKRLMCCCGLQYPERLAKLGSGQPWIVSPAFWPHLCVQVAVWYDWDRFICPFVVNIDTVTCGHYHKLFTQQFPIDICKCFF